jgi:hypothetical protein
MTAGLDIKTWFGIVWLYCKLAPKGAMTGAIVTAGITATS